MMHGYESGPNGVKSQALRKAGFDVFTPDMKPLILKAKIELILILLLYWFTMYSLTGVSVLEYIISCTITLWISYVMIKVQFNRLIYECIELQKTAVKLVNPDIVIGSSFGGLIALNCVNEGVYHGPVLLLAPVICGLFGKPLVNLTLINTSVNKCLIVHGTNDKICSIENSRNFVKKHNNECVELIEIEDGDHSLRSVHHLFPEYIKKLKQQDTLTK